jgi:hypothetical protein
MRRPGFGGSMSWTRGGGSTDRSLFACAETDLRNEIFRVKKSLRSYQGLKEQRLDCLKT